MWSTCLTSRCLRSLISSTCSLLRLLSPSLEAMGCSERIFLAIFFSISGNRLAISASTLSPTYSYVMYCNDDNSTNLKCNSLFDFLLDMDFVLLLLPNLPQLFHLFSLFNPQVRIAVVFLGSFLLRKHFAVHIWRDVRAVKKSQKGFIVDFYFDDELRLRRWRRRRSRDRLLRRSFTGQH